VFVLSIGFGEIILILLIAFVVVGPEDLPKIAKTLASWIKKIRTMMREVNKSFESELGLDEIKVVKDEINNAKSDFQKAQEAVINHAKEAEKMAKGKQEAK
jgi:Tat protein translocase TatB subunit